MWHYHCLITSKYLYLPSTYEKKNLNINLGSPLLRVYHWIADYTSSMQNDGNGKDEVEKLPDFLSALDEGYDLVQGSRFSRGGYHKNTPINRYIGVRFIFSPVLSLASRRFISDPTNAFRAISRKFLLDKRVLPFRQEFVRFNLQLYIVYRAASLGFNFKEIPVSRIYPDDGSVPTKIHGKTVLISVLEMFKVAFGCHNP